MKDKEVYAFKKFEGRMAVANPELEKLTIVQRGYIINKSADFLNSLQGEPIEKVKYAMDIARTKMEEWENVYLESHNTEDLLTVLFYRHIYLKLKETVRRNSSK